MQWLGLARCEGEGKRKQEKERGMALAQKLAQFKNQQDRLQATLAKIPKPVPQAPSKAAASSSRKAPQPPPSATPVIPFAQRFSFQNDQEKLQQIATIRKSPVGAQIKRVLDLLLEVGSGRVFFLFDCWKRKRRRDDLDVATNYGVALSPSCQSLYVIPTRKRNRASRELE